MSDVIQALQVMAIGLPIMFGVIILFMFLTIMLNKLFPDKPKEEVGADK
jgi:hypothetical protein